MSKAVEGTRAPLAHPGGRFDLLSLLPEALARTVLDGATRRTCPAGSTIYCQGDVAREFYRIVSGSVRLSFIDDDGREVVFVHYERHDCFGYSSLIDGKGLPHTAEAFTDVELQVIKRGVFDRLRGTPAFDDALLRLLCGYVRVLSNDVAEANLDELSNRLALRLLEAARPNEAGLPTVRMSQSELGLMVGATRQWVNKLLRQFQDDGLVQLAYGAVLLRDTGALRKRAEKQH